MSNIDAGTAGSRRCADAAVPQLAAELRMVIGQLRRRAQSRSSLDLTPSQTAILVRLERDGPATASALARDEGMRPQSMGANIAVLEAAGLVGGAQDPGDRRQTLFSLTAFCRKRIQEGRLAREDWLTRALEKQLSPQEQAVLASAIPLLRRIADS